MFDENQKTVVDSSLRLMSDCQDGDFFWEALISPGKRKRKKKNKKCAKHQHVNTKKSDEKRGKQKKKKNSKLKEAMTERKEKRKKKSKPRDQGCGFTGVLSSVSGCVEEKKDPESSSPSPPRPSSSEKLKPEYLNKDSKKTETAKRKKKKKVAFDLSARYIPVKRPKFTSWSSPKKLAPPREVREAQTRPQVTDSQCTSDDINSQDLFITQKKFRAASPPPDSSGGDVCDDLFLSPPPRVAQEERNPSRIRAQTSHAHLRKDSQLRQPHDTSDTNLHAGCTKEEEEEEGEGEGGWGLTQNPRKNILSNQRLGGDKKTWLSRGVTLYRDVPVVDESSVDASQSKASPIPRVSKSNASTQTENFFTSRPSSFLGFCQKNKREDLKPLDLSLPQRIRKNPGRSFSEMGEEETSSEQVKGHGDLSPRHKPRTSAVKTEVKGKAASEPKSADTATSSEDGETPGGPGKHDMTQVRAIQTRLNESFFFKTKGERQSHRPESPLMKMAQGRESKSSKSH